MTALMRLDVFQDGEANLKANKDPTFSGTTVGSAISETPT